MQVPDFLVNKKLKDGKRNGLIKSWSFSAWQNFAECPRKSKIEKIDKIRMPSGPAAERGTEIHDYAENYINGSHDKQRAEMKKHFEKEFDHLRDEFTKGNVSLEGEWGFDEQWNPCEYNGPDIWVRIKLDAMLLESETSARVIDFKTGQRFGNEVKHSLQGQLYTIATFLLYPKLEFINTEFWYLDKGGKLENQYTRDQALLFLKSWELRGASMTNAVDFPATPSKKSCRWCRYKEMENPETGKVYCEFGIS